MSRELYVEGELYISLETAAEIFQVQAVWLREVYDFGLLGRGVDSGPTVCVAATNLDRIACIVRLSYVLGRDVEAISLELDGVLRPPPVRR